MIHLYRPVARVMLPLAIATLLASCSGKTFECKKLSSAVNEIRPVAEQFQQEGKKFEAAAKAAGAKNDLNAFKSAAASSSTAFNQLITQLDQLINKIQTISLQDETLINLRDQYVRNATAIKQSFQANSQALATISTIENSPKGLQELRQAAERMNQSAGKINTLVQEERKMVTDFNTYCEVDQQK